jgi:hypothetical protein
MQRVFTRGGRWPGLRFLPFSEGFTPLRNGQKTIHSAQAVDMLASAMRRARIGSLQRKAGQGIGTLIPRPERGTHAVRFLPLEDCEPSGRVCGAAALGCLYCTKVK